MVPAGGPYYMISRNLGPELGGAVGILFYLGTTVAASMYILGAAEIFMLYIYPKSKIFDDTFMCYRLYGTLILIMLSCIVVSGVKVVNKFALPTVFIVNLCILLSFGGVFVKISGSSKINYCMVGDRLANLKNYLDNHEGDRVACNITELTRVYCHNASFSSLNCDSHFYLMAVQNRIEKRPAIRGLRSSVIFENIDPKYADQHHLIVEYNESVTPPSMKESERIKKLYVFADVTSSFIILVGVFFPSVTGIMAGSNRSGNLKDASQSIPRGTIAATTISSVVYLAGAVLFGATLDGLFMRDKFGESAFGKLVIAELAVPHYMAVCVGSLVATMGAGMQSLTGQLWVEI
uniref:Amino acid permease/ SLC12A domain-containing protein n=1 Tax=Romanomermis culicivorax TaxID=13658 RepID=A0A915K3N0_ROMCU